MGKTAVMCGRQQQEQHMLGWRVWRVRGVCPIGGERKE
jgi:hypothetical protein